MLLLDGYRVDQVATVALNLVMRTLSECHVTSHESDAVAVDRVPKASTSIGI